VTVVEQAPPATRGNPVAVVLYLSLGSLAFSALQSLVAPALSTIGQDLHATSGVSWILTAYLLAASIFTPVFGRLADIIGKRRVLIIVLVLLLIGTVLAAAAPNLGLLITARAVQGSAGAILPLSISIARDSMPPERVSTAIGILSAIFGVGGGIGILAAGPILQALGWTWLFWFPAILIVVALAGTILGVPDTGRQRGGRIDITGATVLGLGLAALLLATSEGAPWGWGSTRTLGLLGLGVVTLVVFVAIELRLGEPLIDVRAIRARGVWTAHAAALIVGFLMFGLFILVPSLLEAPKALGYGFGATATQAGLVLVPAILTMVAFSSLSGVLVRRLGPKPPLLAGSTALTIAYAISALTHAQVWIIALTVALAGLGIGFALSAIANAVVHNTPATQTAEALSTNTIARTIGSSIGTAVIAATLTTHTSHGAPTDADFTTAFWISTGVGILAVVIALAAPATRRTPPAPTARTDT